MEFQREVLSAGVWMYCVWLLVGLGYSDTLLAGLGLYLEEVFLFWLGLTSG